ncbi:MAG: acyltransferase family protein [Pyrinomonadaceae bacterium]
MRHGLDSPRAEGCGPDPFPAKISSRLPLTTTAHVNTQALAESLAETSAGSSRETSGKSSGKSSGSARLRSIDALRGAAALAVVLYHAVGQPKEGAGTFATMLGHAAHAVCSYGYAGVFLFFVISGFCIHLSQAKAQAEGRAPRVRFFSFWRRRVRRLYPPYLVALLLYLWVAYATGWLHLDRFFAWDLSAHLLMLHNFDARTCYSINSVFWTLAIEEQLYLAYFLLLFLRRRWGWTATLAFCFGARVACLFALNGLREWKGIDIPVPEAAATHWFTWALGALAVESAFGLVRLPRWCRSLSVGAVGLVAAATLAWLLPIYESHPALHEVGWLLVHPLWGFGFFAILNRAVAAERAWRTSAATPEWIARLAAVGLVSYSLYLTHQLVLLETWKFEAIPIPATLVALVVMVPLCLVFAWLFFWCFERPFLARPTTVMTRAHATRRAAPPAIEESPATAVVPEGAL